VTDRLRREVIIAFEEAGGMNALAVAIAFDIPMAVIKTCRPTCRPSDRGRAQAADASQPQGRLAGGAVLERKTQIFGRISDDRCHRANLVIHRAATQQKGTLTGATCMAPAEEFNARPPAERLHIAKEQGEKLHPAIRICRARLAVGWNNMEFARMAWGHESDPGVPLQCVVSPRRRSRFQVAGDQVTYYAGWRGRRDQR